MLAGVLQQVKISRAAYRLYNYLQLVDQYARAGDWDRARAARIRADIEAAYAWEVITGKPVKV